MWLLFLVSFYLAKYVALGIAFVPIYLTIINGLTHVIAGIALRRYNPGLYTSLLLFFPWGFFLLIYFGGITGFNLLFNGIGLLAAVIGHAIIVVYALKRRRKLQPGPWPRGESRQRTGYNTFRAGGEELCGSARGAPGRSGDCRSRSRGVPG